jgi:hypothetical protein
MSTHEDGANHAAPGQTQADQADATFIEPHTNDITPPQGEDDQNSPSDNTPTAPPTGREFRRRFNALTRKTNWLIFLNIAVAIGTGFQAFFAFRSNQLTRDAVAQASAANRLTRELADRSDRPWVGYSGLDVITRPSPGVPWVVHLTFVNSGKTPAFNVAMDDLDSSLADGIPSEPVPRQDRSNTPSRTLFSGKSVLFPSQPTIVIFRENPAHAYEIPPPAGRVILFWGKVTYDDSTGKPHTTSVCLSVAATLLTNGTANFCSWGNDAN